MLLDNELKDLFTSFTTSRKSNSKQSSNIIDESIIDKDAVTNKDVIDEDIIDKDAATNKDVIDEDIVTNKDIIDKNIATNKDIIDKDITTSKNAIEKVTIKEIDTKRSKRDQMNMTAIVVNLMSFEKEICKYTIRACMKI
jgi:hypothetical protein